MLLTLAAASLLRHRARTLLAILGVAVSAGMLLDMVMLSSGMRESFRSLLVSQGFQLRISPKGTLPFDTEATIRDGDSIVTLLRGMTDVMAVSPVLGGQLHIPVANGAVATSALGIIPSVEGDYELVGGRQPARADEMVANDALLRALGRNVGDTVHAGSGYDSQLRSLAGERVLHIVGRARFVLADVVLYMLGRLFGARLFETRLMIRVAPPEKRERIRVNFDRYGIAIFVVGRLVPGIRTTLFLTAGSMRLSLVRFIIADGLGAMLGTSLFFMLGFGLGASFKDIIEDWEKKIIAYGSMVLLVALVAVGCYLLYSFLRDPIPTGDPKEVPLIGSQIAAAIPNQHVAQEGDSISEVPSNVSVSQSEG